MNLSHDDKGSLGGMEFVIEVIVIDLLFFIVLSLSEQSENDLFGPNFAKNLLISKLYPRRSV